MLEVAVLLSVTGLLVALLVALVVYAVGVYLLHGPPQIVGLVALLVFVLLLVGDVGVGVR